ncbi:DUF1887 family protein [Vibrio chagasii]|nr:DUF1887 family protein [Vibrio chagasii]
MGLLGLLANSGNYLNKGQLFIELPLVFMSFVIIWLLRLAASRFSFTFSRRAAIREFIWLFMLALSIRDPFRLLTHCLITVQSAHIVFIGDKNQVDMYQQQTAFAKRDITSKF